MQLSWWKGRLGKGCQRVSEWGLVSVDLGVCLRRLSQRGLPQRTLVQTHGRVKQRKN